MKYFFLTVGVLLLVIVGIKFLSQTQTGKSINNLIANQSKSSVVIGSKGQVPSIPFSLPKGYQIHIFATGLGGPRDLQFSPNGTLLVSNPKNGEVIALPDKNNDGVADSQNAIITGENHPHGLAFYGGKLFVADVDKVVRYNFDESTITATKDKELFSLPQNNDHNNRTLTFDNNGKMYLSVGSTCNVCRENSKLSATVLTSDVNGSTPQIFAAGLRNAPFTQINPTTGELWGTEMGRDLLGDNIPPDEIDIIKSGNNYGWPNCYGNKIHDTSFDKSSTNPCPSTTSPIFEIPAHSAPLGLVFINSSQFAGDLQGDLLVSYHGSWNRSTPSGFKVVLLKVEGNQIVSSEDFMTGFLSGDTNASAVARPVDLTFDTKGNLYLSDDKGGNIFIIQKSN